MDKRDYETLSSGEVFDVDLFDSQGNVVLEAGTRVSDDLIAKLTESGSSVLYLIDTPPELSAYAPDTVTSVHHFFEDTPSVVEGITSKLQQGERIDQEDIDRTVDQCLNSIGDDSAVVLASAISCKPDEETSARNVRLSSIAMVAAREMGFSEYDCKAAGRAGLLCDVALSLDQPRLEDIPQNTSQYDRALADYLQHPLRGAELLRAGVPGISQLEIVLVSQVHEQSDGSGFPRGLQKHHLHPLGRLLNIIDAFLSLTDANSPSGRVVPADALAYLVLHSLYGTFDRDCIQALVKAAAVYPIGTQVLLNDNTSGVVLRSNNSDYMEPVIQLQDSQTVIDLRTSERTIISPVADGANWQRLPKSKLNQSLWMKAA